jgi:hypothetical protein
MTAPTAVCRVDGEPLVSTLAFYQAEFVCVVCGRTYGFLEPDSAESTPTLSARHEELHHLWVRMHADDIDAAQAKVGVGGWGQLTGREQRALTADEWRKRHD